MQNDQPFTWLQPAIYEFEAVGQIAEPKWNITTTTELETLIEERLVSTQGTYGWYVMDLDTKATFGKRYNQVYTSASVNKVPTVVWYLLGVEADDFALSDVYTLNNKDKEEGTGGLQYQKDGKKYSYEELIMAVGQHSDNTAINAIMRAVGRESVQAFVESRGMDHTNMQKNTSSPLDMGELFAAMYLEEIFEQIYHQHLVFKSLTHTDFEDRISAGVPEGVDVIHKIGNQVQVWNDCGIVKGPSPYVLCIMTDGVRQSEAEEILPFISEAVWEYFVKNSSNNLRD